MKYAVLLLATVTMASSFAQDKAKKFEFGFGGGANYSFSSMSGSHGKQIALPGFKAGVAFDYMLSKKLFLTTKISYVRQNAKYKIDMNNSDSTGTSDVTEIMNSYSWITAPIHLNYIITPKRSVKFFIGLGIVPSRLIDSKIKIKAIRSLGMGVVSGPEISSYDRTNEWNFFASSQVGVQIPTNQCGKILIALSFERSLMNLVRHTLPTSPAFDYTYNPSNIRLNSFSVEVSYVLNSTRNLSSN